MSKESFSKRFIIVAAFTYNGKINIKRVEGRRGILRSTYYQKLIVLSILKHEIPPLYHQCHQSAQLHQDKETSRSLQSTVDFSGKIWMRNIGLYPSLIFLLNAGCIFHGFLRFWTLKNSVKMSSYNVSCILERCSKGMGQNTFF